MTEVNNPFDLLNDVGCCNEQIMAALELLSDELHDEMETAQDKPEQQALRDRLYRLWLTLELIRAQIAVNDRRFHTGESVLYRAGVPRQFQQEGRHGDHIH